ncbi:MAG: transposase [Oceanobacter sp.]
MKTIAANAYDGHQLEALIDDDNSSADVWAGSAYRREDNERMLKEQGYRSHVHRKKPQGKDMPEPSKQANKKRSQIRARSRARAEHPFKVIKQVFGYSKVRYRGLHKNTERLCILAGFANLLRVQKVLLA